jgi:hypothetical protein
MTLVVECGLNNRVLRYREKVVNTCTSESYEYSSDEQSDSDDEPRRPLLLLTTTTSTPTTSDTASASATSQPSQHVAPTDQQPTDDKVLCEWCTDGKRYKRNRGLAIHQSRCPKKRGAEGLMPAE